MFKVPGHVNPINRIVGLDISLRDTGFCIVNRVGKVKFVIDIPTRNDIRDVLRQRSILSRIIDYLHEDNDTKLGMFQTAFFIEGYAYASRSGKPFTRAETVGIIKNILVDTSPVYMVPPTNLKKFITGKGNASKDDMSKGVFATCGYSSTNDNCVDAISLALYGYHFLQNRGGLEVERA